MGKTEELSTAWPGKKGDSQRDRTWLKALASALLSGQALDVGSSVGNPLRMVRAKGILRQQKRLSFGSIRKLLLASAESVANVFRFISQCAYFGRSGKHEKITEIQFNRLRRHFTPCGTRLLDSRRKSGEAISQRK
jgi:hypothetical protein